MRRLHLVRHAPVVVDFAVPAQDWTLAADAAPRVHAMADSLAGARLRRIVVSTEAKALGTGRLLGEALGLPVEVRDGLEEHHRLVEQQSPDRATFEANVRRFFARPGEVVFGTESADRALARFRAAVAAVMAETGDNELVVSHGTVMSLLVADGGSATAMDVWSSLRLPDLIALDWPGLRRLDDRPAQRYSFASASWAPA